MQSRDARSSGDSKGAMAKWQGIFVYKNMGSYRLT